MRKFFQAHSIKINKLTFIILLYSFILLFIFLKVQVLNNSSYKEIVYSKGWKEKTVYGERGKIFDSNNKNLAASINRYTFWVNTNKIYNKNLISKTFSEIYNKPITYYLDKLNKKSNYLILEKNSLYLESSKILKKMELLEGLRYERKNERFYPYNNLASHILGYVNLDGKGMYGIEENFNSILSGDTSKINLRKGVKGKYHNQNSNKIKGGYDIYLTIDVASQQILQEELEKYFIKTNALAANGIIVDPYNGNIVAMASFPDYNPNYYFNYNIENYKNRAISESYEPGSTFKIIALSKALESHNYSIEDSIDCENGKILLLNNKILRDHEPHEKLSLLDVFAHSSNIGTSKIIDGFNNIDLYAYCKNFGFGLKTGIPFKSEAKGKIRSIENWSKTSKNYISIGQELSATSIQLAMAYSAIANGGYLLQPNIIDKIQNEDEVLFKKKIKAIRKVIDEETSKIVINGMEKVITYGTAGNLNLNGYRVAGKTGTAQKFIDGQYSPDKFVSSFISIFPSYDPKYVILISIDSPEYGFHWANESAVPVTKEVIKRLIISEVKTEKLTTLHKSDLKKNNIGEKTKNNPVVYKKHEVIKSIVPNLKGKTLKEALRIANTKGLLLYPNAINGKIISQYPKPGTLINDSIICNVELK